MWQTLTRVLVLGGLLLGCGTAPPTASTAPSPSLSSGGISVGQSPGSPSPTELPAADSGESGSPQTGLGPFTGGEVPPVEGSFIADVRTAAQDGFDRVVFEFTGVVPTYRVEYAVEDGQFEDIEGNPLPVAGNAFVSVTLDGTSRFDFTQDGSPPVFDVPYPARITGDTVNVTEVVEVLDFEAQATWLIGLTSQQPLTVTTQAEPGRLVIDVAHRGTVEEEGF